MVSIRHVEIELHIRVSRPKGTKCASGGRGRVREIAPCKGDVTVHVRAAVHPRGWFYRHEFGGRASDQLVSERWEGVSGSFRERGAVKRLALTQETLDEVGKGGEIIHPLPPP